MPLTYQLLARTNLSTTTASVVFSAIPATYNDLTLVISARDNSANQYTNINVQCNSATSTYSATMLYGNDINGTGSLATTGTSALPRMGYANGGSSDSNTFSSVEYYVCGYATSDYKQFCVTSATENNSASGNTLMSAAANLWLGTTPAITTLTLTAQGGNSFVSGSSFYLYGIKNS